MNEDTALLHKEISRLKKMVRVLMDRAESSTNLQGSDFSLFQTTIMLDDQIRARTLELETALSNNDRINRALRESEAKFRALVDQAIVGIAIIEAGRFTYTNTRFCEIFGYSPVEVLEILPADIAIADNREKLDHEIRLGESGKAASSHYQIRGQRKSGEQIDIEIYSNTVSTGERRVRVSVFHDITERCRAERQVLLLQEELRDQSLRDALTGLYNRRYLADAFVREQLLAKRKQQPVALIISDLDHFKAINDRHGHQGGDAALVAYARLLKESSRGSDICCRYGGEEFLQLLPGMNKFDAAEKAENLRRATMEMCVEFEGKAIPITASFGVASFPFDGNSPEELVAAADAALYRAKRTGRNKVSCTA